MINYKGPGDVLTLTAPAGDVVEGQGVQIGQLFVVAATAAVEDDPFQGMAVGVFGLPKDDSDAWTEGELIYWDGTECTVTDTANLLIGCAAVAAEDTDTTGFVRLNGKARANEAP